MPLRTGTPMPELTGATEWLNGEISPEQLAGSPTLVHFWAMSCHLCHDNMPKVQEWREKYARQGLKVVAVHMPRQEEDTHIEAVKRDAEALGVTEPCAIDNYHEIGERFQNPYWPAYFFFDKDGLLKSRAAGDAGVHLLEGAISRYFAQETATA